MQSSMENENFKLGPSNSCAIIKTNGLFGSKPLKRLPQTNLLHKKKTKKLYSTSSVHLRKSNFCLFPIGLLVRVKVTTELKVILEKILNRSPRCKIFRDLYYESDVKTTDCLFTYVFSLESEHPIQEKMVLKRVFELVIISTKQVLVYDSKFTCIDNDNLIIFHCDNCPRFDVPVREKVVRNTEYNFVSLPGLSSGVKSFQSPKFVTVLSPKRNMLGTK